MMLRMATIIPRLPDAPGIISLTGGAPPVAPAASATARLDKISELAWSYPELHTFAAVRHIRLVLHQHTVHS